MKTVQFLGYAPNVRNAPAIPGAERWCFNSYRTYHLRFPEARETYTRWFDLHSKEHILKTRYQSYDWYKEQTKPIYLQEQQEDIPSSLAFPAEALMKHFGTPEAPETFFTCSAAWMIALAIYEGFERIDVWGIAAASNDTEYNYERPCIAYWVGRARQAGIEVFLPPSVDIVTTQKLYGYETNCGVK
jgi:hypothetical protein